MVIAVSMVLQLTIIVRVILANHQQHIAPNVLNASNLFTKAMTVFLYLAKVFQTSATKGEKFVLKKYTLSAWMKMRKEYLNCKMYGSVHIASRKQPQDKSFVNTVLKSKLIDLSKRKKRIGVLQIAKGRTAPAIFALYRDISSLRLT